MESHLLQMRGLKHKAIHLLFYNRRSHLLQMRGLKPAISLDEPTETDVASFTDAWIETLAIFNTAYPI